MVLDLNDLGLSRALMFFGKRELEHKYILEKYIGKGDTVLDLGANIGYYACMEALLVGNEGKIIALEPDPKNFNLLKINVRINFLGDRIICHQGAGGLVTGTAKMYLSNHSNLHSFLRDKNSNEKTIEVDMFSMKDIVKTFGDFDFLRMDIEGYEVEVLSSFIDAINIMKNKPKILFETHLPKYTDQHNLRKIMEELFKLGYKVEIIASNESKKIALRRDGYHPEIILKTDGKFRGIYYNIKGNDAIEYVNSLGGVRAILFTC